MWRIGAKELGHVLLLFWVHGQRARLQVKKSGVAASGVFTGFSTASTLFLNVWVFVLFQDEYGVVVWVGSRADNGDKD